jgi:hypothetical protein
VLYGNKLKLFNCPARFYCCWCALNDFQCYNVQGQDTQDGRGIVINEISNKYGRGGILISSNVSLTTIRLWTYSRTMPCLKRMTNPKFCYHSCCLKTSRNMQHNVDNLQGSVLKTMKFYKGANLIFSSQFSDMCSVLHLTVQWCSGIWSILSLKTLSTWRLLDDFSFNTSLVLSIHNP